MPVTPGFQNAQQLVQKFVNNYGNVDRTYKTINAIVDASNQNTSIRGIDIGWLSYPGGGKLREAKITYFPMDCNGTGDCSTSLCDTGTPSGPKQVNFQLKRCTASKIITVNKDDLRYVDANWTFSSLALELIAHTLPDVRKELAIQMLSVLNMSIGCQNNGAAYQQINTSDPAKAALNPAGRYQIERVFMDAGFTDKPFFLGNYEVDNWEKGIRDGGVNYLGQRIDKLPDSNLYYDALVDKTLGINDGGNIIAFDPQVIKFMTFSENAGLFRTNYSSPLDLNKLYWNGGESFINGSIYDPITKLVWDFDATYDICTKQWNMQYRIYWDIFQMPDINCNDYPCTNGIYLFKTCPEVIADCPTANVMPYPTPGSPVSPRTFTTTPAFTYPFYLGHLVVNGYMTTPNVEVTDLADFVAAANQNSQVQFAVSGSNITTPAFTAPAVNANGAVLTFS